MAESSKEGTDGASATDETITVPSPSFFDDIKFYVSGNVSEKVNKFSWSIHGEHCAI